jgi:hypothetical protein
MGRNEVKTGIDPIGIRLELLQNTLLIDSKIYCYDR